MQHEAPRSRASALNFAAWAVVAVVGLSAQAPANAQAVLDMDDLHTESDVFWYDNQFFYHGNGWSHNDSTAHGTDWTDTRTSAYTNTGFSGTALSRNTTSYVPSNPGVGGTFNRVNVNLASHADITASDLTGPHFFEDSYGMTKSNLAITLGEATDWTFEADIAGSCSANGWDNKAYCWFRIYDSTNSISFVDSRFSTSNGDNNYDQHVSLAGNLAAGSYLVYIQVWAECANFSKVGGGTGSADSTMIGSFAIPAPGAAALLALAGLTARRRR